MVTNSLGMKFVPVPGTDALFCVHETRFRDYAAFAADVEGVDGTWKDQTIDSFSITNRPADHPVMKVSWDDARRFCQWLSEKEGRTYRLPTDREWSQAVGLGDLETWDSETTAQSVHKDTDEFPWGREWPPPPGSGNYRDDTRKTTFSGEPDEHLEGYHDGYPGTAPVMSFEPNEFGLYDLGGNACEWCEDWYDEATGYRVMRGASWHYFHRDTLLSSCRIKNKPERRWGYQGFRCVLVPQPKQLTNSLGMKFVSVPGTEVLFCIHETRFRDYAVYAAEAEDVDNHWKNQTIDSFKITGRPEDHPVTQVSWEDAQKFCRWLSQREGKTYRLPTDREWSCAVGIGSRETWIAGTTPASVFKVDEVFPWGTEWPPPPGSANIGCESRIAKAKTSDDRHIQGYNDGFPTTAPVMSFKPNMFGIYDLSGNAIEWCEDWFRGTESSEGRVMRGGSWHAGHRSALESSYRPYSNPTRRYGYHGFRCVVEVSSLR